MSSNNRLMIHGIKTRKGILITDNLTTDSYTNTYGSSSLNSYLINGEQPRESFNRLWFWVDNEPTIIKKRQSQPDINHRYVLIDPSLESDRFPLEMKREDVATYDSYEYEWVWNEDVQNLRSLYKLISDEQPDKWVEVDFEYSVIMELNDIKNLNGFSYPVQKTQWASDGLIDLTERDAQNQVLDKILFPEPVLHMLPSKLTSDQFYKIVREHIKKNINYAVAEITSDYNFCFTVKKKIKFHEPVKHEREEMKKNGRPYKNRRINISYQKTRSVEVFNMTPASERYGGYTVLPEIVGTDMEDLKQKIDTYLEDLMTMINEPLEECASCGGLGVIGFENKCT